jgi:hypothetical protein
MSIREKLLELFTRDPFYAHILELLNNGQNDVVRFPPFEYFTIPFEGDEVILTIENIAAIETALGQSLVEGSAIGYRGKHELLRLSAPLALKVEIEAVLHEYQSQAASPTS